MSFRYIFYAFTLLILSIFNSCNKVPVYPDTPQIEFSEMKKYAGGDSVIVTVKFKDGNGDLGLGSEDVNIPYQAYTFKKDGSGNYIELGSPGAPPYTCKTYVQGQYDADPALEYVQVVPNPNYYNYFVEIYVNGILYDQSNICPDFNGRFPLLSTNNGPIEGTLSYTLKDLADPFGPFFGQTLKFKIHILDRALNTSNTIETPDVVIN